MEKFNLATTLHLKIVLLVVLLTITATAYNHLLSRQIEENKSTQRLIDITNYLEKNKPPTLFSEVSKTPNVTTAQTREQILTLNKELQPILNDIFMPVNTVKFGFYSLQHESIVAIGPDDGTSLLIGISPTEFNLIYMNNTGQLLETKNSLIWNGATTLTYAKPFMEQGVIVGHIFACRNQDALMAIVWEKTTNTFLGAFFILTLCIIIFRELFIKLKEDLHLFGQSILSDQSDKYKCEIAEFAPIINYISHQTQHMMHLDRLNVIGEMASGIAHEIRNPMTTVKGLLQFMDSKEEFTMHKSNFTLMINEVDRANSIITEFLSLANNNIMLFKKNNLNTIIQEIFPLLQADSLSNNCEIKLLLNTIPDISMDTNSIHQLLLNMIRNAIDAMPEGGIITLRTKALKNKVFLFITDSGVGIPDHIREKLGTPFFTTKETGTGLGLAICYRIVQRHCATLTVESQLGQGTTFTITFKSI